MKRRVPLSIGLASMLMLMQTQNGRSGEIDVPDQEIAPPAAQSESANEIQDQGSPESAKPRVSRVLEALSPESWKEKPRQKQQGLSSWYGKQFHGKRTASGEIFDMHAMTAAHRTLPLQTWVRVTNLANGREVLVRINDRGPRLHSRIIDLSQAAAQSLGFSKKGLARVEVQVLAKEEAERLAGK